MNYLKLDEYRKKDGKLNKKKIIIASGVLLVITLVIILFALYVSNQSFREGFDKYILRKEVNENKAATIPINTEDEQSVYAYDKYIVTLGKNTLKTYNASGKRECESEVKISKPIFASNNRFLVIAEEAGQKLYLISGDNIVWQTDIEGAISKVNVNKNGYVSIVVDGTTYKNVIITYDPNGTELFRTYLSTTTAVDVDVSNDNKYLAIAEMNTSGALVQSNIKIVSVEKAQNNPSEAVEYVYSANTKDVVTNIKYQDGNRLICMYDSSIHIIQNNKDEELTTLTDNKISFADINLKNNIAKITEENDGLFKTESKVSFINISTKKENTYQVEGVCKAIYSAEEVMATNLGSEVHFINENGWLIKKYISTQEIQNIVLCDNLAGIIYRDKIEIINL